MQQMRNDFETFIEKANRLSQTTFGKRTDDFIQFIVQMNGKNHGKIIVTTQPNELERVESFILTYRLFFMGNERISFRSLETNVLLDPDVSEDWKTDFCRIKKDLNQFLDKPSLFSMFEQDVTNRDIQNVFMFGGLAHANNPANVQRFKAWSPNPMARHAFKIVLAHGFEAIKAVATLCERELPKLK